MDSTLALTEPLKPIGRLAQALAATLGTLTGPPPHQQDAADNQAQGKASPPDVPPYGEALDPVQLLAP